jgi:hypothetical protein
MLVHDCSGGYREPVSEVGWPEKSGNDGCKPALDSAGQKTNCTGLRSSNPYANLLARQARMECRSRSCRGGKSDEIESQKSMHKKMLLLYGKQEWAAAINQIAECKGHFGGALNDYYGMLLQRIEVLREHPPGEDWDGVFTAETK